MSFHNSNLESLRSILPSKGHIRTSHSIKSGRKAIMKYGPHISGGKSMCGPYGPHMFGTTSTIITNIQCMICRMESPYMN